MGHATNAPPEQLSHSQAVLAYRAQANLHLGQRVQGIAPEALVLLQEHPWSGNVCELKNGTFASLN